MPIKKVLIVEDNAMNRRVLRNILDKEYEVLEAVNGKEALDILKENGKAISAVLLDISMPVMDGFELLKLLQNDTALSQIPTIVTTGLHDEESEVKALSLGATDYITKPYNPALIQHCLRKTINQRESTTILNAILCDKLTGLYNREAFFDKVTEMIAEKEPGYYLMSCFDIDNFKLINDQYGAQEGDRILKNIGKVCREEITAIGGICSRISADNFAMLFPASKKEQTIVNNLRDRKMIPSDLNIAVTFSVGRYIIIDNSLSANIIYDRAYIAKRSVKGRYDVHLAYFDDSMLKQLISEQMIINEMDSALAAGQFEVWFQPQFNHNSGALVGAEALVRWRHPERGLIMPNSFIHLFEQNGFIYELDKNVWMQVCRYLRTWLDEGKNPPPISINISRYDIFRTDFFEAITGVIKEYNIPVDLLRLEITESAFAKSSSQIIAVVEQLIEFGFIVEIDDFGSGYSSLNTLKDVPANVLKLDMRFLENNSASSRGGNILESIVRMAKWLNMSVIAEGVEAVEQADFLKSIGCFYIQGYLYARPMSVEDFVQLSTNIEKEQKMLSLETVANLDNNTFWDPSSMDTLIFNSYIGGACIFEYHNGNIELLRANDKYAQVIGNSGMTVEDALKLNWAHHLADKDFSLVQESLLESIRTGDEVTEEFEFLDLPGCPAKTYLRSTMRVIATAGDRHLVYCMNENMTAQRQAEANELRASEQTQIIMDDVSCGITASTVENGDITFVFANDKYYEMLGYSREQYLRKVPDIYFIINQHDRARVMQIIEETYLTESSATIEYRVLHRMGNEIWLRAMISHTRLTGIDKPVQLCILTDITAEKKAERVLRETDEQLRLLNDVSHDLLARPDCTESIINILNKLLAYFGSSRAYVFEINNEERIVANTYEVCAKGVERQLENLQRVPMSVVTPWIQAFADKNYIEIRNVNDLDLTRNDEKLILQAQGVKSLIAVPLRRDRKLLGFVGIDDPSVNHSRIERMVALGDYVSVLLTRRDLTAKIESTNKELLDNLPCGAALYEYDGIKLSAIYINASYRRLVGRELNDLENIDVFDAIHPTDRQGVADELKNAIDEQRNFDKSFRIKYYDGDDKYICFHVLGKISFGANKKHLIYTSYFPVAEDTVAYREMLPVALNAAIGSSTELSFVKDRNLRFVCCSEPFAKALGVSAKELVGKTIFDFIETERAEKYNNEDIAIVSKKVTMLQYDETVPIKDSEMSIVTSKYPLLDSSGDVIGIYCLSHDVTASRKTDSQLKLLTDSIPGGLAIYSYTAGEDLKILYFNDWLAKLFGYTRKQYEKITAKNALSLVFSEDVPKIMLQLNSLLDGMDDVEDVCRVHMKNSSAYKYVNFKATVAEKSDNTITMSVVMLDVTEQQLSVERLRISEEEHRLAVEHSGSVICRYNVEAKVITVSPETAALYSFPEVIEDVPYSSVNSGRIAKDTAESYISFYESIINGNKTNHATYQMRIKNKWCWIEAHSSTIFSADGKPLSAVISFVDITEQMEKETVYKKWQQSLQDKPVNSYTLFRFNLSKNASFDTMEGSLLNLQSDFGHPTFDEYTSAYADKFVFDDDKERYYNFLNTDAMLAGFYRGKRSDALEYREKASDGEVRWLRLSVDLVEYPNSSDIEAYLMYENIDDSKRAELLTLERAEKDPLTGVLNRTTFASRMDQLIATSKPDAKHALLILDVDGFKLVNDVFGHGAGDQALIDIADSVRGSLRRGDLLGRLGGDEFIVFLCDIPDDSIAANKARQIRALVRKSFSLEVQISASIGIVMCPKEGIAFEDLYKKADAALYHIKSTGKDNYAFYCENMGEAGTELEEVFVEDSTRKKKKRRRRMLIVDDNSMDLAFIDNIFHEDYLIQKAKNGSSAMVYLRHYGLSLSVVLLDLVMPGMDGFDVLEKMKNTPELQSIPVVVVSAAEEKESSLIAIRAGASDFVTKPFEPELLKIRVESAISKAENERLRAQNSFLKMESGELAKYRMVLSHTATALVELNWLEGTFSYDPSISDYIAGTWNDRQFWHILLSDMVADVATVRQMQMLSHDVAEDRQRTEASLIVKLKTPTRAQHWFKMNIYKRTNEYQLTDKLIITFNDLGSELPNEK